VAGLAFTVYGIHSFAMAHHRYIDSSASPSGWTAIAFLFLSVVGVEVFPRAGNTPPGMPVTALSVSTVCQRNLVAYLRIPKRWISDSRPKAWV
jgi:hypothetical protein